MSDLLLDRISWRRRGDTRELVVDGVHVADVENGFTGRYRSFQVFYPSGHPEAGTRICSGRNLSDVVARAVRATTDDAFHVEREAL